MLFDVIVSEIPWDDKAGVNSTYPYNHMETDVSIRVKSLSVQPQISKQLIRQTTVMYSN